MNTFEKDKTYITHTYNRYLVCFVKGEGSHLYDDKGKEYIDMGTGIGVDVLGISYEPWIEAVTKQLHTLNHVSNLFYTMPQTDLAQALCEKTGMKDVFFSNSGAEANECAIKGARKYSIDKYGKDRTTIVTLINSFHGRTITTLAATGQDVFHQNFFPLTEGFLYTPANDLDAFIKLCEAHPEICAVMVEPIQGEGGVHPLDKDFFEGVGAYAKEHDILLVVDEVQTGNGRTGKLYGYMNYDVTPDIISTAKGLGGGLPIGATLFGEKTKDVLSSGTHGSTFGGNPIVCAGAFAILDYIDDKLLDSVAEKGKFIKESFEGAKGVKSVAGMGLMWGIEPEKDVSTIVPKLLEKGVVVLTAKEKIRLLPALNIPEEDLEKAVSIMKEVLAED